MNPKKFLVEKVQELNLHRLQLQVMALAIYNNITACIYGSSLEYDATTYRFQEELNLTSYPSFLMSLWAPEGI